MHVAVSAAVGKKAPGVIRREGEQFAEFPNGFSFEVMGVVGNGALFERIADVIESELINARLEQLLAPCKEVLGRSIHVDRESQQAIFKAL